MRPKFMLGLSKAFRVFSTWMQIDVDAYSAAGLAQNARVLSIRVVNISRLPMTESEMCLRVRPLAAVGRLPDRVHDAVCAR